MAGKVQTILNLEIVAGKAQPAPPLWPMLGANGVNIGAFTQEFNAKTQDYVQQFAGADVKIKCILTVYQDRTYGLELIGPVTADVIKWKLGIKKGASEPNKDVVGTITKAQLEEVAEIVGPMLNTKKPESIIKTITGTAKSIGIKIVA